MKLQPATTPITHEQLFIERYGKLSGWALQMTRSDHELAEDLVQDAFIQFTFTHPDLAGIHQLDSYLYGLLRNLHLSQVRRSARSRLQPVSIVEYESAETGLQAADARDQIRAQDELRQICHFACARKESSWAGSVLVLRFFLGYYPSEIAQVMRTTRQSVDEGLRIARGEARLHLSSPNAFKGSAVVSLGQTGFARRTDEFLNELRQLIFGSRHGKCLSRKQIQSLYSTNTRGAIRCEDLAHIVSCPTCLDTVNNLLGLPLLADRYPTDTMGRDKRGKGDGGDAGGSAAGPGVIKRLRRRAREAFEHRPKELHISVNGLLQGSQRINSELSEQTLDVDMTEQIGFVEVYSELGIRLLMLNVGDEPPRGPVEQVTRVDLSDSRALELKLRFSSPWPTLHVAYSDPLMRPLESLECDPDLSGPSLSYSEPSISTVSSDPIASGQSPATDTTSTDNKAVPTGWDRTPKNSIRTLLNFFKGTHFWLSPATATALLALAAIGIFFLTRTRGPGKTISAVQLLQESIQRESELASRTDQVFHRTITLEERSVGQTVSLSSAGEHVSRRKIEIWQSAERGITARRLYSDKGELVAGEWRQADGAQTLYHHGNAPKAQPKSDKVTALNFDNVWLLDPSAKDFSLLIDSAQLAAVEAHDNSYVISAESAKSVQSVDSSAQLLRATLILSRSDLHPLEQTLVIRQGNETREYKFIETNFERRAPSTVAPKVFEPEPELIDAATGRRGEAATVPGSPRPPVSLSPVVATADLEVEVLRLLNSAGADLGEQVSVNRNSDGELVVQGLVDTDQRKSDILRALAPVKENPAVKIDVSTFTEALKKQRRERTGSTSASGSISTERIEAANDVFPAYADLRDRFSDEDARRFATAMVNRSHEAMRRAWALKRLLQQFSSDDLNTLSPEARAKWLGLIRAHAAAFARETAQLRQQLAPIFFPGGSGDDGASESSISSDADLLRAVERLIAFASTNDQMVTAAFTGSTNTNTSLAIKSAQFFRSLRSAESLAKQIQATDTHR